MRERTIRLGAVLVAVILLGAASPETPPAGGEPSTDGPAPIHADGAALERAVLDATIAFLHSDLHAAREALDRIAAGCRRLSRDEVPRPPEDELLGDQVFHKTVDFAREFATGGEIDKAFDQFVWAQKTCRTCHDRVRKAKPVERPAISAPDHSE
jgi:hypothetical protein